MRNNLKYFRKELGLSQEQVAKDLYIGLNTYRSHELGTTLPSIELSLRYAEYFKQPVEALFQLDENELKGINKNKTAENYRNYIEHLINKQINKGIRKYGKPLDQQKDMKLLERFNHLEEELVDALVYIQHVKTYLKEKGVIKNEKY